MTLRELRYVVALADTGNFARAAEACHVSQPTLSTQLKKLEEYLGVQLFERTKKRVLPTTAGREIIAQARAVLEAADRLIVLARGAADPFAGLFHLGVIPTLGPYLLPHLLPHLRAAHPKLTIYVREDLTANLLEQLRAGKLDAILVALPVDDKGLTIEPLFREPFLFALPAGHRLAARKKIRQEELAEEHVLLLEEGHCFRDQALAVCGTRRQGEEDFRATSLETLRQMVATGVGTTLMPALAAQVGAIGKRLIEFRPFAAPEPGRVIGLAWRREFAREPLLRALVALIREKLPPKVHPVRTRRL